VQAQSPRGILGLNYNQFLNVNSPINANNVFNLYGRLNYDSIQKLAKKIPFVFPSVYGWYTIASSTACDASALVKINATFQELDIIATTVEGKESITIIQNTSSIKSIDSIRIKRNGCTSVLQVYSKDYVIRGVTFQITPLNEERWVKQDFLADNITPSNISGVNYAAMSVMQKVTVANNDNFMSINGQRVLTETPKIGFVLPSVYGWYTIASSTACDASALVKINATFQQLDIIATTVEGKESITIIQNTSLIKSIDSIRIKRNGCTSVLQVYSKDYVIRGVTFQITPLNEERWVKQDFLADNITPSNISGVNYAAMSVMQKVTVANNDNFMSINGKKVYTEGITEALEVTGRININGVNLNIPSNLTITNEGNVLAYQLNGSVTTSNKIIAGTGTDASPILTSRTMQGTGFSFSNNTTRVSSNGTAYAAFSANQFTLFNSASPLLSIQGTSGNRLDFFGGISSSINSSSADLNYFSGGSKHNFGFGSTVRAFIENNNTFQLGVGLNQEFISKIVLRGYDNTGGNNFEDVVLMNNGSIGARYQVKAGRKHALEVNGIERVSVDSARATVISGYLGYSGLRFSNISNSTASPSQGSAVLGVNASGDVVTIDKMKHYITLKVDSFDNAKDDQFFMIVPKTLQGSRITRVEIQSYSTATITASFTIFRTSVGNLYASGTQTLNTSNNYFQELTPNYTLPTNVTTNHLILRGNVSRSGGALTISDRIMINIEFEK
jgi:hypothetical protein